MMNSSKLCVFLTAILACVIYLNSHNIYVNGSKDENAELHCQTCQTMAGIACEYVEEKKPKSSKAVGWLDLLADHICEIDELCTYSHFKYWADKSEKFKVYEMTAACKHLHDVKGALLQDFLPKYYKKEENLRNLVCGDICAKEEIWSAENHPHKREGIIAKNLRLSEAFLEENKNKAGVTSTDSGLQYEILRTFGKENEKSPEQIHTVMVNYKGYMLNNEVFDSTLTNFSETILDRPSGSTPRPLDMSSVIGGWSEGIALMKPGDIYKFYIPPALGYSTSGNDKVDPNALLIFEVELVSFSQTPNLKKKRFSAADFKSANSLNNFDLSQLGGGDDMFGLPDDDL